MATRIVYAEDFQDLAIEKNVLGGLDVEFHLTE